MKDSTKHIFFDLDHTLWDFEKNSSLTLSELHEEFGLLEKHNIVLQNFLDTYQKVNHKMWDLYNKAKIQKEDMRNIRFNETLGNFGVVDQELSENLNTQYLDRCPSKGHLMDDCLDTLDYLAGKYKLHILTNGFKDSQAIKIKTSQLEPYFQEVITSECSGHQKPHPKMYYYALEKAKAQKHESVMIGDNLKTDILGAKQINMKTVWYNPEFSNTSKYKAPVVRKLADLRNLL